MTDAMPAPTEPAPAPPVAAEDAETETLLDFRKNGGVHLVIDGVKRRLRTPRMRDYRHLYELWSDAADELDGKSEELQEFMLAVMGRGDEREARGEQRITEEERQTDRRLAKEVRKATEAAACRWWVETIRTLGVTERDQEITEDDLPVFLTNSDSINAMLDHWRKVPSRSGAR